MPAVIRVLLALALIYGGSTHAGFCAGVHEIGSAELIPAIRAYVEQNCRCSGTDLEITSAGTLTGISVPDGILSFRIREKTLPASYRNQLVGIDAFVDGRLVRSFWTAVNITVRGHFLRMKTRVPFGVALSADDVEAVYADLPDLRVEYFKSPEEAAGKVARRTLLPGDVLSPDVVANPFLVRNGEAVRLRLERQGVTLATVVRAEQDGRLGQVVRVRNLDFSRSLKARVVAKGEVTVD